MALEKRTVYLETYGFSVCNKIRHMYRKLTATGWVKVLIPLDGLDTSEEEH